jgi:cAMP phosphodiesterase
VKIKLLPGWHGHDVQLQLLTCFVINDCVAADAGSLGFALNARERARVQHIVLTHAHLDHIASMPIFIDEEFSRLTSPVMVYAVPEVISMLRRFIFNDCIWPNFEKINLLNGSGPALEFHALEPGTALELAGLSITPIPVNHTVPTAGLLVEDDRAAVIYTSDTYVTEQLWEVANRTEHLKAIFVDVSYPNELEDLAAVSRHLTPQSLGSELLKLKREAEIHCVHIKPGHREKVIRQLKALQDPRICVAEIGRVYQW